MATWTFAPLGEGEVQGFHNPGVETFKGNLERYLAREAIQNSVDARNDTSRPVQVNFELQDIDRDEVPQCDELADIFRRCANFWCRDTKAMEYFNRARQIVSAEKLRCLRISDANTTGVRGSDEDQEQSWFHLVRSSGASTKGGGEGGSFGLGKHAPFAASRLRTVFYSTRTDDGASAFQGVARLVTFDAENGRVQPTGYLGGLGGRAVRNKKEIPKAFRRTEPGTDVYVLGYHADHDWQEQFVYSVLENFWPAVHRGNLMVTVSGTKVDGTNLPSLLQQYSDHKDFNAHLYHRAYTDGGAVQTVDMLPTLGEVTVRLLAGDSNAPNRVAMVRGTGMVIYQRRCHSRVPFYGVFECRSETGNRKLRDMEPPRHDDWNADLPEKGENRKTKKELVDHIIECVKAIAPVSTETTLVIPDLSQYLPDDSDSPEDGFDGPPTDGAGRNEGFDRTPQTQTIPGRHMCRIPPNTGTGGDRGSESGVGDSGTPDGDNGRTPVTVRSRAFLRDVEQGVYVIIIYPPHPQPAGDVYLSVSAVGDDSVPTPVRLRIARQANNRRLAVPQPGRIGPVAFPRTGPLRIEVVLDEPRRLALDVTAHEVTADEAE